MQAISDQFMVNSMKGILSRNICLGFYFRSLNHVNLDFNYDSSAELVCLVEF